MKARTIATRLPFRHAARRVVQRLVEAIAAARADARRAASKLRAAAVRIDHRRERGRIRRDDDVLAKPALQPEAGHAEIRILVGELQVAGVVGGFRNAPGHARACAHSRSAAARSAGWSARSGFRPAPA